MDTKLMSYFQRSVIRYSKGDVEELLERKLSCAGPLLTVVVNGIDNLGGMCYGFRPDNSKDRSVLFMKEKMGFSENVAKFLYTTVRCGIAHQGMPKIGLRFFVEYDRFRRGKIFYPGNGCLYLNVAEFAYCYLETIERIALAPEEHVHHYPPPEQESKRIFDNAIDEIRDDANLTGDILHLVDEIRSKEESELWKKVERGEIPQLGSASAYTPDNTLIGIDLPPEDRS